MASVRVLFDPSPAPQGERPPSVVRGRLRLAAEGPRKTLATREPQPASLKLRLVLISGLRAAKREDRGWLTLKGELRLLSPDSNPQLTLAADPLTLDDPELADSDAGQAAPRQFLLCELDPQSFAAAEPLKLPLPELPPEVRHIEVTVELTVAGAVESPSDSNDVLDKPVNRRLLEVSPVLCLDTPTDDPAEHNLAFLATIPDDPFEVESLRLGSDVLREGETFFQAPGRVYFRPPGKPVAPLEGVLQTTDGRVFQFELAVASSLRERMASLALQLEHAAAMADAAAAAVFARGGTFEDAELVRDRLLGETFTRKARLLDSIESTLNSDAELAAFASRTAALPAVLEGADVEVST